MRKWDSDKWTQEVESKSTLAIYKQWKLTIEEDEIYDNRPSSIILYRARANCLTLNDRKRFTNEDATCDLCRQNEENLTHFILHCKEYTDTRKNICELQQPYIEDTDKIVGNFLFGKENIETKKLELYKMWRNRERKLPSQTQEEQAIGLPPRLRRR